MTSNPAFTERNIQKANAYLLYSRQEQKSLVTYHTLQSLYVCVWLVNTLTSTAPIGSPIICMWSPADICEQWETNMSFSSADVRGAGTCDEPLRTSSWEASGIKVQHDLVSMVWERSCYFILWYQGIAQFGFYGITETQLAYPVVSRYSTICFLRYKRDLHVVTLLCGIKVESHMVSLV